MKPKAGRGHNQSNYTGNVHLDDFGANLEGASAELLAGAVRILSVHHADVSTASRRDHLRARTQTQIRLHRTCEGRTTTRRRREQIQMCD